MTKQNETAATQVPNTAGAPSSMKAERDIAEVVRGEVEEAELLRCVRARIGLGG